MLCTHPMFGPDSGAGSWAGLNLMFERVRIAEDPERLQRVANFLAVRPLSLGASQAVCQAQIRPNGWQHLQLDSSVSALV